MEDEIPNTKPARSRILRAALGLCCTLSLVAIAFYRLGTPLNVWTWLVVVLAAASGVSLALKGKRRAWFALALLFCIYLAHPMPFVKIPFVVIWSLFDDVGGRDGWEIPPLLKFGSTGPNTALMESLVGPLDPNWRYAAPHSPYIRDGNERVSSRNIIRYEEFPAIQDMLPTEARATVILALTDPENRLRVHQSLLLACLYQLGYPADLNRDSWWTQHRDLFRREHDADIAAKLTWGWAEKIERIYGDTMPGLIGVQLRAAKYQRRGSWGGHTDFGEAYLRLSARDNQPPLADNVVWWEERGE